MRFLRSSRISLIESCVESLAIVDSFSKAWQVINGKIADDTGERESLKIYSCQFRAEVTVM